MSLRQSIQIAAKLPSISADGYEPISAHGDYVAAVGLAATDVIEMVVLPAGYVATGVKLAVEDVDSNGTPTITVDCGVVSGVPGVIDNARTCGTEAFAASTVGQTGGVQVDNKADISLLAPSTVDRAIGLRIGTAAATLTVGARFRLTLHARPALNGA